MQIFVPGEDVKTIYAELKKHFANVKLEETQEKIPALFRPFFVPSYAILIDGRQIIKNKIYRYKGVRTYLQIDEKISTKEEFEKIEIKENLNNK